MDEELRKTRAFADLIERRTGVRLDDADAHILHLRLLTLYRLLIRKPPVKPGSPKSAQQEEHEAA
jgi:hypothetical protein